MPDEVFCGNAWGITRERKSSALSLLIQWKEGYSYNKERFSENVFLRVLELIILL